MPSNMIIMLRQLEDTIPAVSKFNAGEKRYDGDVKSLANRSTRPKSHPNQHTQEELDLIRYKHRYHQHEGYAQIYRKVKEMQGYKKNL